MKSKSRLAKGLACLGSDGNWEGSLQYPDSTEVMTDPFVVSHWAIYKYNPPYLNDSLLLLL